MPAEAEEVLSALRDGATFRAACAAVGVGGSRMRRWRERFPELDTAVKELLEENRRRDPPWAAALLAALERGLSFKEASQAAGVHFVTAYEARRNRPDLDARVIAAADGRP